MTNTKKSSTTMLGVILISLLLVQNYHCWWYTMFYCHTFFACIKKGSYHWLATSPYIHPYIRSIYAKVMSIRIFNRSWYIPRTRVPWMWYYTLPLKSFRRRKPWPGWNHPKYRSLHGRALEKDGDEEDYDEETEMAEYKKMMDEEQEPEDRAIEKMKKCDSVENCTKQACASLQEDIETHSRGHKILSTYYQTALRMAYKKFTGKTKCMDYFELDCMKNISEDVKVDDSSLMGPEKMELAIHMDDAEMDFASQYSVFNIEGFQEMVMTHDEGTCGGNVQNEVGGETVIAVDDSNEEQPQGILNQIF